MALPAIGDLARTSDEELVRAVCSGQRDLFAELVVRHQRSIFAVALGILNNPADAEEVLQESFLKALLHLHTFRGEAKFRTWLTRIAINESRLRLRKYRPQLYDFIDESPDNTDFRPIELRDWRPDPEQNLAHRELQALLERAIGALPGKYREMFLLRDVQHLSSEEAALAAGISVSAAKTRLLRARLMMREYLTPHLGVRWHDRPLRRLFRAMTGRLGARHGAPPE